MCGRGETETLVSVWAWRDGDTGQCVGVERRRHWSVCGRGETETLVSVWAWRDGDTGQCVGVGRPRHWSVCGRGETETLVSVWVWRDGDTGQCVGVERRRHWSVCGRGEMETLVSVWVWRDGDTGQCVGVANAAVVCQASLKSSTKIGGPVLDRLVGKCRQSSARTKKHWLCQCVFAAWWVTEDSCNAGALSVSRENGLAPRGVVTGLAFLHSFRLFVCLSACMCVCLFVAASTQSLGLLRVTGAQARADFKWYVSTRLIIDRLIAISVEPTSRLACNDTIRPHVGVTNAATSWQKCREKGAGSRQVFLECTPASGALRLSLRPVSPSLSPCLCVCLCSAVSMHAPCLRQL